MIIRNIGDLLPKAFDARRRGMLHALNASKVRLDIIF